METKDSLQKFGHKMRVMPTSKKQPNIIKAASNDHFHQDIQNGCKEPGSYSDPKKPFNSTISDWKADLYGFIEFPFKGHIHGMGKKKGGGYLFPPMSVVVEDVDIKLSHTETLLQMITFQTSKWRKLFNSEPRNNVWWKRPKRNFSSSIIRTLLSYEKQLTKSQSSK